MYLCSLCRWRHDDDLPFEQLIAIAPAKIDPHVTGTRGCSYSCLEKLAVQIWLQLPVGDWFSGVGLPAGAICFRAWNLNTWD